MNFRHFGFGTCKMSLNYYRQKFKKTHLGKLIGHLNSNINYIPSPPSPHLLSRMHAKNPTREFITITQELGAKGKLRKILLVVFSNLALSL